MTGDEDSDGDVEPAWHNQPSTLAGASVAALLVLALLFWGVSCVARQANEPEPASQYYLDPSTSGGRTSFSSSTSTATETITSTSPPVTTDIDPGNTSTTSGTDTTTSSTDTTTSFNPSNLPRTRTPSTYDDGRTRPRFNETRTAFPRP